MREVFHLMTPDAWERARAAGEVRAPSLDTEGFVHCSTRAQVPGSANKHHAGHDELIVLELNAAALERNLRWEPSRGGEEFPHVYGAIPVGAVLAAHGYRRSHGVFGAF